MNEVSASLLDCIREEMRQDGASESPSVEPFTWNGVKVHLRALTPVLRAGLFEWRQSDPCSTEEFMRRVIAVAMVNEDCRPILSPAQVAMLPPEAQAALAAEIVKRNRMG